MPGRYLFFLTILFFCANPELANSQPISNPLIASNSTTKDVVCENLVISDSNIYYTGVYRDSGMFSPISGSFVKRFDSRGNYRDSVDLTSILPSDLVYGAQGAFHNDSLTIFGFYWDYNDSVCKSYLLRLSTDFGGYRYNQYFTNWSNFAIVSRARFDPNRNRISAFIDRKDGGRYGADTAFYFEFDPGSLQVLRHDTITTRRSRTYLTDFIHFNNSYAAFEVTDIKLYNSQMDSIDTKSFLFGNPSQPDSGFVPRSALVTNNSLFAFSTSSEFGYNMGYKGTLIEIDSSGATRYRTYSNPDPSIYQDEWIDNSSIYQIKDKFLLLSTLNYVTGLKTLIPTGKDTDVLIRLVDTSSLNPAHQYIIADSCFNYVTAAAETDSGFAILYYSTCSDNVPVYRSSRIAFFNNRAELLSDQEVARQILSKPSEVSIYPNPVVDRLNFELPSSFENKVWSLQLFNLSGQQVYFSTGNGMKGQLELGDHDNGQYILEITGENGTVLYQSVVKVDR